MAKQVEALKIETMNNAQSNEFHTTNIARAKTDANIVADLGPQLTAWENANAQFNAYLKQEQKTLLTEDAKEADSVQDSDLIALKGIARAMLNIPDAEKLQSARRVKLCIDNYDIDTSWEYVREANMIRQMLDDLQGKYAADVTALGIGVFVEKLAQSNATVRQTLIQRENESAGQVAGQTRAWRRETEKAYRAFVEMLNARSLVFGDTNYADFIDLLNASIAHYRQILATAAGRRAAKKNGSSENENENENENQNSGSGSGSGNGGSGTVTPVETDVTDPTDPGTTTDPENPGTTDPENPGTTDPTDPGTGGGGSGDNGGGSSDVEEG